MNDHQPTSHHDSLSERVLERIQAEHLTPRPRYAFIAENWLFWSLGALAVVLGAAASAAALFELANADWSLYAATHQDFLTFAISAAPFLWLLALALFILLGYENIRRTKRGYRYPFALIIAGAVLTSLALGTGLFAAGLGQEVEEAIGDHPPFYRPILVEQRAQWLQPAAGRIGGDVVAVSSTSDAFMVKTFDGEVWTVDAAELDPQSIATVEQGGEVHIEGVPDPMASSTLYGCAVYGWRTAGAAIAKAPAPVRGRFALAVHTKSQDTTTAAPTPAAFATFAAQSAVETKAVPARIQICKGTRPYGSPSGDATGD